MGLIFEVLTELIDITWEYIAENYEVVQESKAAAPIFPSQGAQRSGLDEERTPVFRGSRLFANDDNAVILNPSRDGQAERGREYRIRNRSHEKGVEPTAAFPQHFLQRLEQEDLSNLSGKKLASTLQHYCEDLVDYGLQRQDPKEKLATITIAASALRNAYYSLTSNTVNENQLRAMCAWEVARCMEQGWSRGRFDPTNRHDLQEKAILWLDVALRNDRAYIKSRFVSSKRRISLYALLGESPKLRQALEDDQTRVENLDWSEITPAPARYKRAANRSEDRPIFSYDVNNLFDFTHHQVVAEQYERIGDWPKAADAWQRVVWFEPRLRYRRRLIRALQNAVRQDPHNATYRQTVEREIGLLDAQFGMNSY